MSNRLLIGSIIGTAIIGGYLLLNGQFTRRLINTSLSFQLSQKQEISNQSNQSADIKMPNECAGKLTPSLTEGPYYKVESPMRTNLREEGIPGAKLTLTGYVFDTNCQPVEQAWLDFWQADGNGVYDNFGFKLRGHQFTGKDGKYILETAIPGNYPGRTPHIHVKVNKVRSSEQTPILTTQLFLPDEAQNKTDSIFDESLLIKISDSADGKIATFNFIID